jgi:hypothetical protein
VVSNPTEDLVEPALVVVEAVVLGLVHGADVDDDVHLLQHLGVARAHHRGVAAQVGPSEIKGLTSETIVPI